AVMMLAATRGGSSDALFAELTESQPQMLAWMKRQLSIMPPKAYRWVAEMHEIADFVGEDPAAHELYTGAAHFYEQVAKDFSGDKAEVNALLAFLNKGATKERPPLQTFAARHGSHPCTRRLGGRSRRFLACGPLGRERMAAHVELEHARDADDRLRPAAVLEHGELDGGSAGGEQTTGLAVLLLGDPTAVAVLADQEERGGVDLGHGGLLSRVGGASPVSDAPFVAPRAAGRCDREHEK